MVLLVLLFLAFSTKVVSLLNNPIYVNIQNYSLLLCLNCEMENLKKVYIDSRYTAKESVSNSDIKFEIKESLDLPDNTICYIDDNSIPHTWYTIETYSNQLYIETTDSNLITGASVIFLPDGNYTASRLPATLISLFQARFPEIVFHVIITTM